MAVHRDSVYYYYRRYNIVFLLVFKYFYFRSVMGRYQPIYRGNGEELTFLSAFPNHMDAMKTIDFQTFQQYYVRTVMLDTRYDRVDV